VLDRDQIGANGQPQVGDILVGLPSDGLHTNGYSLARRVLPFEVWDTFDAELAMTVGDALLVPHRSYLPEIQALIGAGARGFAHITGGGHTGNIDRMLPAELAAEVDTSAWDVPPIFRKIASGGSVAAEEMYRVFNMGIGLVVCMPANRLEEATAVVPEAVAMGRIVPRDDGTPQVRLLGLGGGRGGEHGGR
jgi:phosphoribosylformylglycinamidine cyclo-ligase